MKPPIPLFESYLQRRAEARTEPDWLQAALIDPGTLFLLSSGTRHRVSAQPDGGVRIAFAAADQVLPADPDPSRLVLLGWFHGRRCVLVDLPDEDTVHGAAGDPAAAADRYEELRPLLPALPADQAHLLAYARAMLVWRERHRYCGICGAPTAPRDAGHVLACTSPACGTQIFPRIDPAIIVLVAHGRQALLGRQRSWPSGRYSTLAGFVEAGESLESAVVREVEEETGVHVDSVRYFASQAWPFPSSLMLGFHAHALPTAVRLNGELEDARWFDREQLRQATESMLPPEFTIARSLIDAWLCGQIEPAGAQT